MSSAPSHEGKADATAPPAPPAPLASPVPAATVAALFERLKKPILALGFQMLGDGTLAEDVLQETFLLVHRHLAQFRGEAEIDT